MERILRHFKHAARSLARVPGFSAAVIVSLALGIGANLAVFAVVNAVLLRPLPYFEAGRLVAVFLREPQNSSPRNPTSPHALRRWQESRTLQAVTAATPWAPALTGFDVPDKLRGLRASASLFDLLQAEPMLGRTFAPADGAPGGERIVVLSHGLWARRFGGDAGIVGRTLDLDGEAHTVVGVMPPGFRFPPFWASDAEMWTPLALTAEEWERNARYLRVFARLAPGRSVPDAQAEMDLIARRIAAEDPENNAGTGILVEPLQEPVVSEARPVLLVLLAAVGLVLLIACANVAGLQSTRAIDRHREYAIRLALGAKRVNLAFESLAESSLLALAGGALGLLLADTALSALALRGGGLLPPLADLRIDGSVVAFALGISSVAALLFGLASIGRVARGSMVDALAESGRHSASPSRRRARRALAVAEIAVAVMLTAGAGLLLRSVWSLQAVDPGFQREGIFTATISLAGSAAAELERTPGFLRELQDRVGSQRGVEAAGAANFLPIGGDLWGMSFEVEGSPAPPPERIPRASFRVISPGYLNAMGTRLMGGRDFAWADDAAALPVVLVNETLARRYGVAGDVIGSRLRWAGGEAGDPWLTVMGVVADVRQWDLADEVRPEVYFPFGQNPVGSTRELTLAVRTAQGSGPVQRSMQEAVWSIDPNLPVTDLRTIEGILATSLQRRFLNSALVACFALLGLTLAAVGIYGVVAYGVTQRTREFGVRMALGASPREVLRVVMDEGLLLAALGVGLGIAGALALSRFMGTLLLGITPSDPATFAATAGVLTAVTLLACLLPARRAARVDPMIALRHD